MNNASVNVIDIDLPEWSQKAVKFALKVLKEIGRNNWELSILFCGDKTIKKLNYKYRKKNEPTDVLSFKLGETVKSAYLAGDIAISLDSARKNAKKFKISCDEELQRLIIHGILHLNGMNHKTNSEKEPMLRLQEEILAKLNASIIGDAE